MSKKGICRNGFTEINCAALTELSTMHSDLRNKAREEIIQELRNILKTRDYEVAADLKALAEKIIIKVPSLQFIKNCNIKIAYVRSYEAKKSQGKIIFADCIKVMGQYTAFLPYDFIITFYEPNIYHLTENQRKILMLHELNHIGIGERGLKVEPHDIEDFRNIIRKFGLEWNDFNQNVPDILAEEVQLIG